MAEADEIPEELAEEANPEEEDPAAGEDDEHPSTLAGALVKKHGRKKKKKKAAEEGHHRKEEFKKGGRWTVGHENCNAALLAMPTKKPRCITLVTKPEAEDTLTEEVLLAFSKGAKNCDVWLRFLDSFLNPTDPARDLERLELFLKNERIKVTQFFGHLDADGISKLPNTIHFLGLAIGSAEDAAAVAELSPWEELQDIRVSVNVEVDVLELKPLPGDIKKSLYFPGLTDENVGLVKPAIEAIIPTDELSRLVFPSSQLTADGARLLSHLLSVIKIKDGVAIVPSGTWRPDKRESKSIETDFYKALGCGLGWNMRWLYGKI